MLNNKQLSKRRVGSPKMGLGQAFKRLFSAKEIAQMPTPKLGKVEKVEKVE